MSLAYAPDVDDADPVSRPARWSWLDALGWALAVAAATAGAAAGGQALLATFYPALAGFDIRLVPLVEVLGVGVGAGLGGAVVCWMVLGFSTRDGVILACIGLLVGLACAVLTLQPLAAHAVVGAVAGFVGYASGRPSTVRTVAGKLPRLSELRPASNAFPVVVLAALFVTASIVGPPSNLGWVILGVGILALAVARALVAQERRIRALEERLAALHAEDASDAPPEMD